MTVEASLRKAGLLETVGGRDYLLDLSEAVPTLGNAGAYCGVVRDAAARREAVQAGLEFAKRAGEDKADIPALLKALDARMRRVNEPRDTLGRPLTAAEFLRTYPAQREPVIDGLLRRGEVGNVISGPKSFKSWFVMQFGLSVALGRLFPGFPCKAGRVLLLDYELAGGTLAKRLDLVTRAMDTTAEEVGDRFAVHSLRGKRLDVHDLGFYFATIPPRQYDLVVLDPLYHLFTPDTDENSNADVAALYGTLQRYAEALDSALIVVHHVSKGDPSWKSLTDLGAGAGAQSRACDAHLTIRLHAQDDVAVVAGVLRSFAPFNPFCIRRSFPLWVEARDLDPTDLRRPPRPSRPPKPPAAPPEPAPPAWTVERFAAEILTETPQPRDGILHAALVAGVPNNRQATQLLATAEATKKAFRWRQPKDRRAFFANCPQPILTEKTP